MKFLKMLMMAAFTVVSIAGFAQDSTKQKAEKVIYSCPMHPEVTSDKPGKCSKCGMDLSISKKEEIEMYSCPMHPEITSDKPGKCPKCGMALKEKLVVAYACPMKCEGNKTYNKPGKCPVCGMALKEKKDDHSDHQY